ncbi:hypothetical protein EJ110_NYTH26679 [Nymphaea thermarum]|nr:hypothetical protein EJ110_NYTH26679 [Nymphaea thermarum]
MDFKLKNVELGKSVNSKIPSNPVRLETDTHQVIVRWPGESNAIILQVANSVVMPQLQEMENHMPPLSHRGRVLLQFLFPVVKGMENGLNLVHPSFHSIV